MTNIQVFLYVVSFLIVLYYSTIMPFYLIRSRECAKKYEPVLHCRVVIGYALCDQYNFWMMPEVFQKLEIKTLENDII